MYADYKFYTEEYKGRAIPAEAFDGFAVQASGFIDYVTFDRAAACAADNAVKMACCAAAEEMQRIEKDGNKVVTSESSGSYSVSFRARGPKSEDARLYRAIVPYLAHTGLLYRGVY